MPRRRRHREAMRRMKRAIKEVERIEAIERNLPSDPLDDHFWTERERGGWCCPDCHPNHPARIEWEARREIDWWLGRSPRHA